MDDDIRIGVLLPVSRAQWGEGGDPRELVGLATRAEELGYDSLWVNDSLLTPRVEALAMLAAAAAVTGRVTLGTAALMPVLRRPVQAAHALASIDLLSGGRLAVAVGAGFPGRFGRPLYEVSEVPWEGRFTRLDETVALWRRLWSEDGPVSFHGTALRFDGIPPQTRPFRTGGPPIWLGGATPAALARTGRLYDGWLPYPPAPEQYETGLAELRRVAAEAGRSPDALTPALFVSVLVDDDAEEGRRIMERYSRANYGLPLEELEKIQAVVAGPAGDVVARLRSYVDAGARHLVCRIGTVDLGSQRAQMERIAGLLPVLREPA
ncbi:LLM class flavin-dependent oxidoreductase [Microbispora sp. ATCC PTA-5024]|uniref:LLM class flavin-dependent oxidoreductase n=1 Tax=Microbispora sp. ATCC PTA-5024 TaxID=316330 RepID=UPI0003DC67DF|nr:LLM class flavin-dependent oxidoreductase [Microbispora sp. ATCC PTA-5024]ETK34136.1 N5,N10-methylene tetrahydromethanopterin reductase [Microbispora sp. ATCC PTA-5024]